MDKDQMFFQSMTCFLDAFWKINLKEDTIYIYKSHFLEEMENKEHKYNDAISKVAELIEPSALAIFLASMQREHLKSLQNREETDVRVKSEGGVYHHVKMILTPGLDGDGENETVYMSARDIQSELPEYAEKLHVQIEENKALAFQSEENLDMINQIIGSGMWYFRFDHDGEMTDVHWSQDFRRMLGYEDEKDFPNVLESWTDRIHPDDKERVLKCYEDSIQGDAIYDIKYRLMKKNGVYNWFHASGRIAKYPNGKNRIFIGTFVNITMMEDAAKDLNERLDAVLTGIVGGFKISNDDEEFSLRYLSDEVAKIQGYTKEELLEACGGSIRNNCYIEDREITDKEVQKQYAENDVYFVKYRVVHKDGSLKWVADSGKKVIMPDGTILHYSLIQDITEQETYEQQLKAERSRYRDALTQNALFDFSFDVTDGCLREDIRHAKGMKFLESIGAAIPITYNDLCELYKEKYELQFFDGDEKRCFSREGLLESFALKKTAESVDYYAGKTGRYMRILALLSQNSVTGHIICTIIGADITDARREELRQQQLLKDALAETDYANAAKTEFLANMSHDIRTPMNAIIGMTAIAASHLDDIDKVKDCLSKVTTSSKHLLGLINEVLDMSKIESGKTDLQEEPFEFSELIENLMAMISVPIKEKRHNLDISVKDIQHEQVIGDSQRIEQVFMNLIGNAIKYTPEGGNISITLSEKKSGLAGVGCFTAVFEDDGIGMSEEFQKEIFSPFTRAKDERIRSQQGTGLGMALVKNIVSMMNGNIQVESKLNKGSKFTVTFFLKLQDEDKEVSYADFIELPVLIADDEEDACESVCCILRDLGMKADGVLSGEEAVKLVVQNHEINQDYFAAILDWKMPGMNGIETARAIRSQGGDNMPIIVLSAYDWSEIEVEARNAGVNAFISKPLFKSRLVHLFKGFLHHEERKMNDVTIDNLKSFDFSKKRALIVEDNELNSEIVKEILGITGIKMEFARNGKEAVDYVIEKSDYYYDIIFMDVQMPVMDGYEATTAIRSLPGEYAKRIPIIAMTANAFVEDIRLAKSAGMNEHLAKPFEIKQLIEILAKWGDRK